MTQPATEPTSGLRHQPAVCLDRVGLAQGNGRSVGERSDLDRRVHDGRASATGQPAGASGAASSCYANPVRQSEHSSSGRSDQSAEASGRSARLSPSRRLPELVSVSWNYPAEPLTRHTSSYLEYCKSELVIHNAASPPCLVVQGISFTWCLKFVGARLKYRDL